MILALLLVAALFLAFANGANDNFKGVATLFGSGTASYRTAIAWATATTFAGSVASVFLAAELLKKFSGRGLVPDSLVESEAFLLAVAIGAGTTVLLATRFGFPVSTTHGLIGALVGAGSASLGSGGVDLSALGMGFVAPLLFSPFVAVLAGAGLYALLHAVRWGLDVPREWCVCVGTKEQILAIPRASSVWAMRAATIPAIEFDCCDVVTCRQRYAGTIVGVDSQRVIDTVHFLSAGVVSFARGLNDTPKIAALLLLVPGLSAATDAGWTGIAMAVGGLAAARRVAETMSHGITAMNHGQGFASNLATGFLVILASTFGLPVSTTHVSVGSLSGIGFATGQASPKTIASIVLSWLVTLPIAAAIAGMACLVIARFE